MSSEEGGQFNNWIPSNDILEFKRVMARKYGFYRKNMQSFEVTQLIRYYIRVNGMIVTNVGGNFTPHSYSVSKLSFAPAIQLK